MSESLSAARIVRRRAPHVRLAASLALTLVVLLAGSAAAPASVVRHGYLPLGDGTRLNYTLTLPSLEGRFPVVLQYDPYAAGAASDPTWNDAGYAMLGVNFRGTECSQGTFRPLRADIWGADGAEVVDWAAEQPWSDGNVGMFGYSFTGVSQLATAAHAGPALKAIAPGNVFPDLYRDMIYPGGIHNGWIPLWIAARDFILGSAAAAQAVTDPACAAGLAGHVGPNLAQTLDTQHHPHLDEYWSRQPADMLDRVRVPVLGCVTWQDTTVYSRAFDAFREQLDPATTWLVAGNGTHADCPISRARMVRFFDRYLKGRADGWERTPRVVVVHEVTGTPGVREKLDDAAGAWHSEFGSWAELDEAITPVALHLREGGRLALEPPTTPQPPDRYRYPTPTANTPQDFLTLDHWGPPPAPDGTVVYTTPALGRDAAFLGGGSADLWISSTAADTDVQVTLSEVRPDGQELYVQNGWLRVSKRALDPDRSTALRPVPTALARDAAPLPAGRPVLARVAVLPFAHVFRAGSSIRLRIDAPGGYFQIRSQAATNAIHHAPDAASRLVLGHLPDARAHAPHPPCGALLNQPCRRSTLAVPGGTLTLPPAVAPGIRLGRADGVRGARPGRSLRLTLRATGRPLQAATVVLRDARGRVVGRSRPFALALRARRVAVRVTRRIRPGRYRLTVTARTRAGVRVTAARTVRVAR